MNPQFNPVVSSESSAKWLMRSMTALAALVLPLAANAATLTVCPIGCDVDTVQGAILLSSPGDTVEILSTTPMTETEIVITKDITIQGLGKTQTIVEAGVVPGVAAGRVFNVFPDVQVTFRDLTIRNGVHSVGGGGVWIQPSTNPNARVTMERVQVRDNEAPFGGGIFAEGPLFLDETSVVENEAMSGGGIYSNRSLEARNGSNVSYNTADSGGGLYLASSANTTLHQIRIEGNRAEADLFFSFGGGIRNSGTLLIDEDSLIRANTAYTAAGIYHSGNQQLTIRDSEIHENTTSEPFGYVGLLSENSGAGIYANAPVDLRGVKMRNNEAQGVGAGGAVFVDYDGSLIAERSEFSFNSSVTGGGAIFSRAVLTLSQSAVHSNMTDSYGGGILISFQSSSAALTNVSILNNRAELRGGGLYLSAATEIASSTIAGNIVNGGSGGGVDNLTDDSVSLRSSILAGNYAGIGGTGHDCTGGFSAGSFSLIGNPNDGCGVSGITAGMITGQSAQFSVPMVTDTFATRLELNPNSPAIDSGSCASATGASVTTDQRGAARTRRRQRRRDRRMRYGRIRVPARAWLWCIACSWALGARTDKEANSNVMIEAHSSRRLLRDQQSQPVAMNG